MAGHALRAQVGTPAKNTTHGLWAVSVFVGYLATGYLSLLTAAGTFPAVVWFPAGIGLAALLLGGYRLLPGIVLGAFVSMLMVGAPLGAALGVAVAAAAEALVSARLITHYTSVHKIFRRPRELLLFFAAALAGSAASAGIATVSLLATGAATLPIIELWLALALSSAVGILTLTPLFLTWLWGYAYPVGPIRQNAGEAIFLLTAVLLINVLAFMQPQFVPEHMPLLYLSLLPLTWAAVRFGPSGTTLALFINMMCALTATALGYGPFAHAAYASGPLFMQVYVGTIAATFLVFSGIVKEQLHTGEKLTEYVRRLEEALSKISSQDRAKTEFLAVLAHELRNPLAPVLSALELIKLKGLGSRDAAHSVAVIDTQIRNTAGLLDDLLDISRIAERKVHLVKELIDVRTAISHSIDTVGPLLRTLRHTVRVAVPDHPLMVEADPLRLEQVLVNLLNNAAKYTNPGGMITVSASGTHDTVTLTVKDTGIGIAEHMLERIFEPFLQVGRDTPEHSAGLGIGLSLTKQLVEIHGGTIRVESAGEGSGSEFIINLPAASSHAGPKPASGVEVQASTAQQQRVLIVDDNEPAAQGLGKLFEHTGHDTRLAFDGVSAVELAGSFRPALVILDIGLPDLDGYEVAQLIRKRVPAATIVAVTGYGQAEDKERAPSRV